MKKLQTHRFTTKTNIFFPTNPSCYPRDTEEEHVKCEVEISTKRGHVPRNSLGITTSLLTRALRPHPFLRGQGTNP